MKPDILQKITQTGLQFMGCYRAANGVCFFLAGRVENKDYGDKEGYKFDAWREQPVGSLEHAATLIFLVSRSALATARVAGHLEAEPDLLKRIGLGHLKRMLDEGQEQRKIILTSSSAASEFEVNDPSGDPLVAQRRLRDEILRNMAVRHARGEQTIRYDVIRDGLCADEAWIQRAFRLLGTQLYVDGLSRGYLCLTDAGHLAAEDIIPTHPVMLPQTPIVKQVDKPMHCFVSYAREDGETVKNLVAALTARGIQVWWDRGEITLGDRLSQKIEEGLSLSRYGLIIVSRHFIAKNWPQAELRALHARAMRSGQKVILPLLLGMTHSEFGTTYPLLDDLVSTEIKDDLEAVAEEIVQAIKL